MAVFLTKNAPGLRTSPVKRGYWVVKRVLGERIPPPPADVPELPRDEAKLGPAAARDAGAAPRATRAAPPATRGSIRSAWCSKATARSASGATRTWAAGRSTRRPTFPGGSEGAGVDGLRAVHPRAPAGRFRRQPVPQAARLRPGPQPACCPTSRSIDGDAREAGGERLSLRQPGREHRDQPAVPQPSAARGRSPSKESAMSQSRSNPSPRSNFPADVPARRRRDDGAAVAGVAVRFGRPRRWRRGARADGAGVSQAVRRRCSWATASTATTGGPRAAAPTMKLEQEPRAARAAQDEDQRHQRPVQQAASASASTRARPATSSPACRSRRAPISTAASAWTRCSPTTSARRRCSRAWCWAASSR